MVKSMKNSFRKNNVTKKKRNFSCNELIYRPFEKEFKKNLRYGNIETKKIVKIYLEELSSQFKKDSINPKNDFYNWVNKSWLKNKTSSAVTLNKEEGYIVEIDSFRIVQNRVYDQLNDIITEYIKNNKNKKGENLNNFYKSSLKGMDDVTLKREALKFVEYYDELRKDKKNIWKLLAFMNRNEMISELAPLTFVVAQDNKNSKYNTCYIYPHTFFLTDINVYYDDGTEVAYKKKFRDQYFIMIKKLFKYALGDNKLDIKAPFTVAQKLFNTLGCTSIKGEPDNYNVVTEKDALEVYQFNWNEFCKEYGFSNVPSTFVCSNLNYLNCCTDLMLKEWDSDEWKSYWVFMYIKGLARLSNSTIYKHYFDFAGSFERGLESKPEIKTTATIFTSFAYNKLLTKEYVDKYEDPIVVKFVTDLYSDIIQVFTRIVSRNKWTTNKTRLNAVKKLEKIEFIAGHYPYDRILDDPDLDYTYDFYDNMMKIVNWRRNKFINLVGKSTIEMALIDWQQTPPKLVGTQAYVVNAAYTPSKNNIFVNLGYMQKPFVDLTQSLEYNLARVGFTVGHEMSHCLDDWGSQYDAEGNLNDWWTPEDKRKYKKIQEGVIRQYEAWAKRDGINFNASGSIGEDLADISGLANCNEFLRQYLHNNKKIASQQSQSFKEFHLEFAVQQRQKIPKAALSAQLKTNPHPPDVYRTNVPLSRSQIFVHNMNIKKGDGMYWKDNTSVWV
jgi:putative endopeptidase